MAVFQGQGEDQQDLHGWLSSWGCRGRGKLWLGSAKSSWKSEQLPREVFQLPNWDTATFKNTSLWTAQIRTKPKFYHIIIVSSGETRRVQIFFFFFRRAIAYIMTSTHFFSPLTVNQFLLPGQRPATYHLLRRPTSSHSPSISLLSLVGYLSLLFHLLLHLFLLTPDFLILSFLTLPAASHSPPYLSVSLPPFPLSLLSQHLSPIHSLLILIFPSAIFFFVRSSILFYFSPRSFLPLFLLNFQSDCVSYCHHVEIP